MEKVFIKTKVPRALESSCSSCSHPLSGSQFPHLYSADHSTMHTLRPHTVLSDLPLTLPLQICRVWRAPHVHTVEYPHPFVLRWRPSAVFRLELLPLFPCPRALQLETPCLVLTVSGRSCASSSSVPLKTQPFCLKSTPSSLPDGPLLTAPLCNLWGSSTK